MRTTLVSDAHLSGIDDPTQDALVTLLQSWDTDEWVLVGDIFDTWWGWRRAVYSAYIPVLAAIRDLVRRGVSVTYVPGNHDFDAGPVLSDELGVVVTSRWTSGHPVPWVAVHGDEADDRLVQRVVDRTLRGRPARAAMRLLGTGAGWSVSRRLSHASRAGSTGPDRILEQQEALADRVLAEGAGGVFVGHSHAPGRIRIGSGELVNLGDWASHRTFAVLEAEAVLLCWNDGDPSEVTGPPAWRLGPDGRWPR